MRSRRPKPSLSFEQRFEVEPGSKAQVDFASFKTSFGTVLLMEAEAQLTVLAGLHEAFIAFGGVPRGALFDRLKTAVSGQQSGGEPIFNAEMLRFAAHYGFQPLACRPYRAKTKGRVERAVSYLRKGFFYGRSFRDLEDLNEQCRHCWPKSPTRVSTALRATCLSCGWSGNCVA